MTNRIKIQQVRPDQAAAWLADFKTLEPVVGRGFWARVWGWIVMAWRG